MKMSLIATAAAVVLAACVAGESKQQGGEDEAPAAGRINQLTIKTRDYVFYDMPDTITAGATEIRLENAGPELHHVQLVRLEEGKTVDDLLTAVKAGPGPLPAWAVDVGGPNTPVPSGVSTTLVDFEAGNYAIVCVIPSRDGVPHFMKGMVRGLTVVSNKSAAMMPAADIVLTLRDYSFEFDQPITSRVKTIRVENAAQQSHEALLVALEEGKSVSDLLAWLEHEQGPPPGRPLGGTTAFAQGEVNIINVDIKPGKYALICFVPDATDGQPHIAHGMVREFTVTE